MADEQELDLTIERWETFHAKPHRTIRHVRYEWPREWGLAGRVLTLYYESSKWHDDGRRDRYYHDTQVRCWEPRGQQPWLRPCSPPVRSWPRAGAVLGTCLGWDLERHDDGRQLEAVCERRDLLCSSADGSILFVVRPRVGITAVFRGKGLSVEADGIVG